jgi:serine phosphatase RsbU (regulator of sigma subunit)
LKETGTENTGMITKTDEGMYELRYNDLLAPMVKAIQELNEVNEKLKSQNEKLQVKNENLEERLTKYEQMQNMLAKKLEQLETKDKDVKNVKLGEK